MSNTNQPTSQADEIKVVALLARGDSNASIAREVGVSAVTVGNIRDRNLEMLNSIKGELVMHKTKHAKRLLDKTHDLIERKLDQADNYDQLRIDLQEEFDNGVIDYTEYSRRLRKLPVITLSELTAASKEMFNQSQIEEGKPTSIGVGAGGNSKEAEMKLQELINALHGNDEVKMLEILNA